MNTSHLSSTSELWSAAHSALVAGKWSSARRLLEDLARRNDNRDTLAGIEAYWRALQSSDVRPPLDRGFAQLLQDRIDAVNASVMKARGYNLA